MSSVKLISRLESVPVMQALKDLLGLFVMPLNVKIVEFGNGLDFIVDSIPIR